MFGMTAYEYWDDDCTLAIAYRKKNELEKERNNQQLWLQGLYIYKALTCVAPVMRAFSKATKPLPYPDEPFPLTEKTIKEAKEREEQVEKEAQKAKLTAWMDRVNSKMRARDEQG